MVDLAPNPRNIVGFQLTRLLETRRSELAADVISGFGACPKWLPPKYFYDELGARLFDAICRTPEYYPTRTEQALLERVAGEIVAESRPTHLIELGSGAARKTRTLLDALVAQTDEPCYVPVDISEEMLVRSGAELIADYPGLRVHGVVADYDDHLHLLPREGRRLIAFLGSTIGNFDQPSSVAFVSAIASSMSTDDRLLVGFDLVKAPGVLHAAYNDSAGITADFNKNVLRVINRELDGDFDLDLFDHDAKYLPEQQQIEMYLVSRKAQRVTLRRLHASYTFGVGERIRTEISRKYTRHRATLIARAAGLSVRAWHVSSDGYFALMVAGVAGR